MPANLSSSQPKGDTNRNKRLFVLGAVLVIAFIVWIFTMLR